MKKHMLQKLHSVVGETITEVLVALLISALALAMLASMIQAASNMITTSKTKMDEYYKQNNVLGNQTGTGTDPKTFTFSENSTATDIKSETYTVKLFENKEIGGTVVISYKEATS